MLNASGDRQLKSKPKEKETWAGKEGVWIDKGEMRILPAIRHIRYLTIRSKRPVVLGTGGRPLVKRSMAGTAHSTARISDTFWGTHRGGGVKFNPLTKLHSGITTADCLRLETAPPVQERAVVAVPR